MINFLLFRGGEHTAFDLVALTQTFQEDDILYSYLTNSWYLHGYKGFRELRPEEVPAEHRVLLLILNRNQT